MSLAKVIYLDDVDEILEAKINQAWNKFETAQGKKKKTDAYFKFKDLLSQRSNKQIKKMEREQGLCKI